MEIVPKGVCKVCGKVLDEPVLGHCGREHIEVFKTYPNPLADVVMREEGRK